MQTQESAHPESNKLSGPLLSGALEWHHLQRAWYAPTLGPQQGALSLQMDAMVTRCDSCVSFFSTRIQWYLQIKWKWRRMCKKRQCTHRCEKQTLLYSSDSQGFPVRPPVLLSLFLYKQKKKWRLISLFAQQFTPIPLFLDCKACEETSIREKQRREQEDRGIVRAGRQRDESTLYQAGSQHRDKHHLGARALMQCVAHLNPRSTTETCCNLLMYQLNALEGWGREA